METQSDANWYFDMGDNRVSGWLHHDHYDIDPHDDSGDGEAWIEITVVDRATRLQRHRYATNPYADDLGLSESDIAGLTEVADHPDCPADMSMAIGKFLR